MANSPARAVIDVGSVIADTYKIEALIGQGGMGSVFLASHNRLPGKKVAIKLLHAELVNADVQARFKREAQIASKLGHPNIVEVHDFNVMADGTPYLVLDYLEGESLAQRLRDGPLPLDHVISIVRQIGGALAAAHREGIVHRDLKPQNIFLVPTEVGDTVIEVAKVLDFGISKWRGSETVKTQESTLLGTPQYMAPEQATGQHANVDERTDVFALGAIVFEMLSGQPAFTGASIPEVVFKVVYEQPAPLPNTVPVGVVSAIKQAMAKSSDERFRTVGDFVEALTGQPLAQSRGSRASLQPMPEIGAGTGRRVNSGKEAFDNTIGSGDHGPQPVAAPAPAVHGSSPTVDSQPRLGADVGLAATSVPPTAAPRRSLGLIAGLTIACIAATALVMYFAMRGRGSETPKKPRRDEMVATTPVPADAAQAQAQVGADAAKAEVVAVTPDAADPEPPPAHEPVVAKAPKAVVAKAPKPSADDDPTGDSPDESSAREQLQKAEAALAAKNFDLAERIANSVNNTAAKPKQLAQARAIRAIVACVSHNDAEGAQIELRSLARNPVMRKRALAACQRHGLLEGMR
jgi:serine/threonine protein kinase